MPTLLIKNVSDELLKELKKLKAETGCRTWADLLSYLIKQQGKSVVIIDEEYRKRTKNTLEKFLELREVVGKRWGEGSVVEEFRRARHHGNSNPYARR